LTELAPEEPSLNVGLLIESLEKLKSSDFGAAANNSWMGMRRYQDPQG
jgi:hypothetical protein